MTPTRYYIFLVAHAFGYRRKNIRMGDAAGETHLLKEAEYRLGKAIWENVADIDELSVEYWNLRKLDKERKRVAADLETLQSRLAVAHEERASLLGISNELYMDLIQERQATLITLEELARERDLIVARAREVRRTYEGIKTKEEVLRKEGNIREEASRLTDRLAQLKLDFSALKIERHEVAEKIARGEAKVDAIDAEIEKRKDERRVKASEAFLHIGDANHELAGLRSELGVLDARMRQLYTDIGKYVSRNSKNNPACRKACKEQQGLVDVMGALAKSILLNHKLGEKG
jgi:chromosome segregation ATPase